MLLRRRSEGSSPSWTKRNGDFLVIAFLSGFITLFLYICYASTDLSGRANSSRPFNFGFSPALTCEPVGLGEPVCVPRRR